MQASESKHDIIVQDEPKEGEATPEETTEDDEFGISYMHSATTDAAWSVPVLPPIGSSQPICYSYCVFLNSSPLEELYLSRRRLGKDSTVDTSEPNDMDARELQQSKSMVDLRYFGGGNQLVKTLSEELKCCEQVIGSLCLKDNMFTDEQGSKIVSSIKDVHELKHLEYSGSLTGRNFVGAMAESNAVKGLKVLNLSSNKLGNRYAVLLFQALLGLERLRVLNLSDNQLGNHLNLATQLRATVGALPELYHFNLCECRVIHCVITRFAAD